MFTERKFRSLGAPQVHVHVARGLLAALWTPRSQGGLNELEGPDDHRKVAFDIRVPSTPLAQRGASYGIYSCLKAQKLRCQLVDCRYRGIEGAHMPYGRRRGGGGVAAELLSTMKGTGTGCGL